MNEETGYEKSLPQWQALLVPPLGIEPGPTEPESVILSFKLQGQDP